MQAHEYVASRRLVPVLRRSLVTLLALGGLVGPAHAQSAGDRLEGPIPEEVRAFREAGNRFKERMVEVEVDTRRFVALREQEERAKITTGYDALLAKLGEADRVRRDESMARLESFLERYPDVEYSSGARFRLADLYFEIASERYLAESARYGAALESDDIELLETLVEPRRDLSQSIEMYERIIADNLVKSPDERWERLDATYLMLAFCYHDEASLQRDEERAKQVFRDLVREVPESELADRSYLALGNFAFADSEYDAAIADYEQVVAKGPESPYYSEAQYQLAWGRFKRNEFNEALDLFTALLDDSVQLEHDTGRESNFAPDARKFVAFSVADMGLDENRDALDVAQRYFQRVGEKPYEHDVYVELADVLGRYGRYDEQIQVYKQLQDDPRWVNHPDNPEYQYQVVMLYSRGAAIDLLRAGDERLVLTQRYGEGSDWWMANRNNPDALAVARGYIESGLLEVAIEYFVRAQEAGDPVAFAIAAEKFQEYLDTFPIADDYYDQHWYLAQSYRYANRQDLAAGEFEKLIRSKRYHPYGDGALYELMNARLQLMAQASGTPEQPCEGCRVFKDNKWTVARGTGEAASPVERTYTARGDKGEEIRVYGLTPDRAAFVQAADAAIAHVFQEPDPALLPENYPDYKGAIDELRHKFLYMTAQILYYHNRFDEARPRLERILNEYPRTIEADYAAGLLIDSYVAEGDLEQVRRWSKKVMTMVLGPAEVPMDRFQGTLEGSTFMLAHEVAKNGDPVGAAEAFLAFMQEFPGSRHGPDALHNAAFFYQEAGKNEQANELYEQFVVRYPDNPKSRLLYFRLAGNYEAIFELEKAIGHYEELRRRFPDDPDAPDALWNAAFLRVGLGQHLEAARGYEEYAEKYPEREDREETHWRAGEQYEKVSDEHAFKFYRKYLDTYGLQNPNHAIAAEWRIAKYHEKKGDKRAHERQLDKVIDTFDRIIASGADVGAEGHRYAAAAAFRHLQTAFDRFASEGLTRNEDKDTEILFERKPEEMKAFESQARTFVSKYRNFEWNSGALLLQARAALYYADLGLSLTCPKGYTDDLCFAYEEVLEEQVFPKFYDVEAVGVRRLEELIEAAAKQKKHSPYIDQARAELNRRDPLEYPAVKPELRGRADATIPVRVLPRSASGKAKAPAPPAPEPPPPAPEPVPAPEQVPGADEPQTNEDQ